VDNTAEAIAEAVRDAGPARRVPRRRRRLRERKLAALANRRGRRSSILQRLEAESIHIMREVVAECEPGDAVLDRQGQSVMLHLALKAFYPARPPFPLLHVDTTWKFREMIAFRDEHRAALG
jgi:3'-phosphoadenosine 5'-phosphosulfate sulfotransferase (PAPS reductase)/FAD synthetase